MISLKDRIKMAWQVLRCKPFWMTVEPYHPNGELKEGFDCDNRESQGINCLNKAVVCMTRTIAEFKLSEDDHMHLCDYCAGKLRGCI